VELNANPRPVRKIFSTRASFGTRKTKKEIDARIAREIHAAVDLPKTRPFPPPRTVPDRECNCEGCHTVEAT